MVTDSDLREARDKVLMGVERRSVALSELDRVNCAYHEAGHAVVAALLPMADPLHKVTIIPRGRAMGVTMQLPEADRHTYTKGYLETQIAMVEAGVGAAVLPTSAATACAKRNVTMHAIVDPVVWTQFCWVSSRSRTLSSRAEDFGEFLRGYLTHMGNQAPRVDAQAA